MNTRIGQILLFSGDYRQVTVAIRNVDSFSAVSAVLRNGTTDVTSLYIDTTPYSIGNTLVSDKIGGKAVMPHGNYRYFISGEYDGKIRTWFWDVLVLPQDLSVITGIDISTEDYNPFVEELTIFDSDKVGRELTVPGLDFSAVDGKLRLYSQDVTASYCSGVAGFSGDTLTTHSIGGAAPIPPGDYAYFLTGTHGEAKSTWVFPVKVLPKQGVL